jgi:hypothetical protein
VDAELPHDSAPRRPQNVLDELHNAYNVASSDRLSYRRQPGFTQASSFVLAGDRLSRLGAASNLSALFLRLDGLTTLKDTAQELFKAICFSLNGIRPLTGVDAGSEVSPSPLAVTVKRVVRFVELVVNQIAAKKDVMWPKHAVENSTPRARTKANLKRRGRMAFFQRIKFC